jgi:hypothetical protein
MPLAKWLRRSLLVVLAPGILVGAAASAAQAACGPAPPPPARIEWVDFNGNENVLIDHRTSTMTHEKVKELVVKGETNKIEKPQSIEEFESKPGTEDKDKVEWKSPQAGETIKNWPVAYPKQATMKVKARLAIEAATRVFLETKLEGEPKVVGKTTVGGTNIEFKPVVENAKEQLEKHPAYLETTEVAASVALPNKVAYESMTIKWEWTIKEAGTGKAYTEAIGSSQHNLYLTYEKAVGTIYFTLLALDTELIEKEPATPKSQAEVIGAAWKGFAKPEIGEPKLFYRTYEPKAGTIKTTAIALLYYEQVPSEEGTLEKYKTEVSKLTLVAFGKSTALQLLEYLTGECGAWQRLFGKALQAEGVKYKRVFLRVEFKPNASKVCEAVGTCWMLVKSWKFEAAGFAEPFPYGETEIKDQEGAYGQDVKNPLSYFVNHQLVEAEHKLYDPSYGTEFEGALGTLGEGVLGGGIESEEIKSKYQSASIAGFCSRAVPERCASKAPGGEVGLSFVELAGEEETAEEEQQ